MTEFIQSYMPILASEMGHLGDNLSGMVHWLMLVLFVGWGSFFIYTLLFHYIVLYYFTPLLNQ